MIVEISFFIFTFREFFLTKTKFKITALPAISLVFWLRRLF